MSEDNDSKTCFVIAPIGEEGTDTRTRSDQVLRHIIEPVAKECGYTAIRADSIPHPGIISLQIIEHLVSDELVIADLTDRNPNVFYELAIRHAFRKPSIHIIDINQDIPFDLNSMRTIKFDYHDLDSAANCRDNIASEIRAIESSGRIENPISVAMDLQQLQQGGKPLDTAIADIRLGISSLATEMSSVQSQLSTLARASDLPRMSVFAGSGSGTYSHGLGVRPDLIILQSSDGSPVSYGTLTSSSVHVESAQMGSFAGIAIAVASQSKQR